MPESMWLESVELRSDRRPEIAMHASFFTKSIPQTSPRAPSTFLASLCPPFHFLTPIK